MKTLEVSQTVRAPIESVFAVASDLPRAAEFISAITEIEMLTDGPVGEGTKWRETRMMFGRKATEVMWITEWDPPNGYVVEARSHGSHYMTSLSYEALGAGETRIRMTFGATAETVMAKVMMLVCAFMTKTIIKCFEADLRDIKTYCEAGGSGQTGESGSEGG
jgi:uncharacterized membrane protein